MKKLLAICLLMAMTVSSQAQQKPTKEETVAFINRTAQLAIGINFNWAKVSESSFTNDKYRTEFIVGQTGKRSEEYSLIKWENLLLDTKVNFSGFSGSDELTKFRISFSSNVLYKREFNLNNETNKNEYINHVDIIIPKAKAESIWKACLRLAEIAKEENKDPFQN